MSRLKEKWKQTGRRQRAIILIPISCLLIAAICTGVIFIAIHKGDDNTVQDSMADNMSALGGPSTDMENVVTADGSLEYGTTAQDFDITISASGNSNKNLQIEEVYKEAGDTVSEGDDLYKLTDDSVEYVRTLLKKELADAQNSLDEAQIDYADKSLDAKYTYIEDSGMKETELAEYEEKVEKINKTVDDALDKYQAALDITNNYPDKITDMNKQLDSMTDTQITAKSDLTSAESTMKNKQLAYDKQFSSYQQALKDLKSITATYKYLLSYTGQDTSAIKKIELSRYDKSSDSDVSNMTSGETVATDSTLDSLLLLIKTQYESKLNLYNTAKNSYDKAAMELEEAKNKQQTAKTTNDDINSKVKELEQNISQCSSDLTDAKNNLATLKNEYEAAKLQSESDLLDTQKDYDVNVMTYSNAKDNYENTISELDSTLQEAKDSVEEAQNKLDEFENVAGDGIIKASQDGTLSKVMYETDDYISSGALVYYVDNTNLTITVSVPQESIALVNVGDDASVYVSGDGMYTGTVKTVASESQSESVSNVTYDVTVSLEEDSSLSGGTEASVYFNMKMNSSNPGGMNKENQTTADAE